MSTPHVYFHVYFPSPECNVDNCLECAATTTDKCDTCADKYIVSNDAYLDLIKEQLPDLTDDQILLEPNRRNTAPCIAYASYKIASKNPDAVTVVTPADHAVFMEDEFVQTCKTAIDFVDSDNQLVTIGIKPSRPETGSQ